jgi:transposase
LAISRFWRTIIAASSALLARARASSASTVKILWHDGLGLSLYAKRLERGRFVWPATSGCSVSISAAQLAYMLDYPCECPSL